MMPTIIFVEAVLAHDDHRSVFVIGRCENADDDLCQWFEMPIAIDQAFFLADEWTLAAREGEWRLLCG